MLYSILFFVALAPITLFVSVVAIIFGRSFHDRVGDFVQHCWGRGIVRSAGVTLDVDFSALDPDQNYVFLANHISNLDIAVMSAALDPWHGRMVAKESLFSIPLFGWGMRRVGHVAINRENPRQAMRSIDQAVANAKSGLAMVVFPEGTRNPDPDPAGLQEFQIGGMVLAIKTGLPVAPVIIEGSGRIWPKGSRWARPGTVKVRALAPIPAGAYTMKDRERFKNDLYAIMNPAYQELHRASAR